MTSNQLLTSDKLILTFTTSKRKFAIFSSTKITIFPFVSTADANIQYINPFYLIRLACLLTQIRIVMPNKLLGLLL